MKKVLCMAAIALLAASCSNNEENIPTPDGVLGAKAIQIGQTVQGVTTKAAIVNHSKVEATVLMLDDDNDNSPNWDNYVLHEGNTLDGQGKLANDNDRATVASATFTAGTTNQAVGLNPALYYAPNTKSTKSHLLAVAPAGKVSDKVIEITPQDGLQDVMYAKTTKAGSHTTAESTINLAFEHKTTQISFEVKLKSALANGWKDKTVSVKNITIQQAELPVSVAFATGTVNWAVPTLLSVPNISDGTLTTDATKIGEAVMLKGSNSLVINVTLGVSGLPDVLYNNVEVTASNGGSLTTVEGSSHVVTLTVEEPVTPDGATAIKTTATVAEWTTGAAGTGSLK